MCSKLEALAEVQPGALFSGDDYGGGGGGGGGSSDGGGSSSGGGGDSSSGQEGGRPRFNQAAVYDVPSVRIHKQLLPVSLPRCCCRRKRVQRATHDHHTCPYQP